MPLTWLLLVSSYPERDIRIGTQVTHIPNELMDLGIQLWGSKRQLLGSVRSETIFLGGTNVTLASFRGDDTLKRLEKDLRRDPYHLRDIARNRRGLIVDVGANIGDVSVVAALNRPLAQVVAIEAVPHNVWFIRYNLFLNKIPEIPCNSIGKGPPGVCVLNRAVVHHNVGLAYNGDVDIAFSLSNTQNAALANPSYAQNAALANPNYDPVRTVKVRAVSALDFVIPSLPILLLKVDCEGCEFDLVPSLGERFFDRSLIQNFAAELHLSLVPVPAGTVQPETMAKLRTSAEAEALFSALRRRGCKTNRWDIYC